jgi:hypothetical protein
MPLPRGAVKPNPSLEGTRTGMALGPPAGLVHHPSGGPSATPARAPQLKRSALQEPQSRERHWLRAFRLQLRLVAQKEIAE